MNAKNSPFSNKPLLFGVISTLVVLGSVLSYLGTQSGFGSLLSQFSGANVTHMNAAQLWQPSTTNPHRTAITTYSTRLDAVVKNILGRGTSLTATEFANYLNSLSTGINSLAKSPKYVRDTEVQKISAYLEYELIDTEMALASGNLFFDDLAILVNNTGGTSASSATKIPGKCGTLGPLQCESGAVSGNELQAGKAIWYCDGINGGQKSTQCSMVTGLPPTNIISTNTTACNVPDIVI